MNAKETETLLTGLLEDNGVEWAREMGLIRFRLRRGAMQWEADCQCLDGRIVLYGRYPFRAEDRAAAMKACNEVNLMLDRGAMMLPKDGRPVFRTCAEMDDIYDAALRLHRAIDGNVRGVTRFWGTLERACRINL